MDDEGVSTVIAVILMTAIVVVLGAMVWVLVSSFDGGDTGQPVSMVGEKNERDDQWKLLIGSQAPQERITFSADKTGLRYAWNETATSASPLLTTTAIQMEGNEAWAAGAYLSVCSATTPVTDATITFVDVQNNSIVTSTTFDLVNICT